MWRVILARHFDTCPASIQIRLRANTGNSTAVEDGWQVSGGAFLRFWVVFLGHAPETPYRKLPFGQSIAIEQRSQSTGVSSFQAALEYLVSNEDKFELRATIKKVERSRTFVLWGYMVAVVGVLVLWPSDLSHSHKIVSCIILVVGAGLHREILNARIDTLRSSFRNVLISRDKSVLEDPDY